MVRVLLEQLNPRMRDQARRKLAALRATAGRHGGGARRARGQSEAEELLAFQLRAEGLDGFVRQYRFCPGRLWRADFAWTGAARLLVEVQGGVYARGRHTRGAGYEADRLRQNEAVLLGWRVLEFTPRHVQSGRAVRDIRRALGA